MREHRKLLARWIALSSRSQAEYQWSQGGLVGKHRYQPKHAAGSHPVGLSNSNWLVLEERQEQAFLTPLNLS